MAKYTIEDIEILRQKSGISYEEAVNLLEYHNGSLARALVDLEKNGRLKNEGAKQTRHKGLRGVIDFLFHLRIVVRKEKTTIINLSSLFLILAISIAPFICVVGLILSLMLGYRIAIERNSAAFADEHIDEMFRKAKSNVQNTVNHFTHQFSGDEQTEHGSSERAHTESAASGTRPVNVQFPDGGSVDVRDDGDGYHEADIQ